MKQEKNNQNTQSANGGEPKTNKKSQPKKASSQTHKNGNTFDPNKYILKLPKTKKIKLANGMVRFEQVETDYLPVAPRIAWFRREHPEWSIITQAIKLAHKAIVMKAVIRNADGRVIATARKKDPRSVFQITSKKPKREQSVEL